MNDMAIMGPAPQEAANTVDQACIVLAAFGSDVPLITGFSPGRGEAGTWVDIFGSNLIRVTNAFFNGVASNNFAIDHSGTRVSAQVPPGAVTGPFSLTRIPTNGGPLLSATSIDSFLVKPRITSISPLSGPPGMTTVRIFGTGLGADVFDRPVVKFNGVPANEITRLTATDVAVTLPQQEMPPTAR
jgi:hypothetical protein